MKTDNERRRTAPDYKMDLEFLSPDFKRNLLVKFCLVVIFGAALSGIGLYIIASQTVTTTFQGARLKIISTADFILPAVLLCSVLLIAFIGILTIIVVLLDYHKSVKSLCQIKEEIDKVNKGNFNVHLKFRRKNDEFKLLAQSADQMVQTFRDLLIRLQKEILELELNLTHVKDTGGQNLPENIRANIEAIKREFAKLEI